MASMVVTWWIMAFLCSGQEGEEIAISSSYTVLFIAPTMAYIH